MGREEQEFWGAGFGLSTTEEKLADAISDRNYNRAYSLLRRLEEPLSGREAEICLTQALWCTPRLFGEVLRACRPGGEYMCDMGFQLPEKEGTCGISGSLLTLAAAADRAEHMQLLLERGYDVNAASPVIVSEGFRGFVSMDGRGAQMKFSARGNNRLSCCREEGREFETTWWIDRCTPLAAAIACGSMEATSLLLRQPGVWKEESSAVCRAAVIGMGKDCWRQRLCILEAFPLQEGEPWFRSVEDVLEERHFHLLAVYDLCTAKQLERLLKTGNYTEAEGAEVLQKLGEAGGCRQVKQAEKKLLLLAKAFPGLCREPWAVGVFLRAYLDLESEENPCPRLLRCWKKLSGKVGDLTWALGGEDWRQPLEVSDLRRALPRLAEGMELVVDADALHSAWSVTELKFITKYARLVRTPGLGGVSGYAGRMLLGANPKALSAEIKKGHFRWENKRELMAFARHHSINPALRHVILSMEQEPAGGTLPEGWGWDPKWEYCKYWDSTRAWWEDTEGERWVDALWQTPLSREETEEKYLRIRTEVNLQRFAGHRDMAANHPRWGKLEGDSLMEMAVCGENPALLEILLQEKDTCRPVGLDLTITEHPRFHRIFGSPLTVAAAAGRMEQAGLLLERGWDVNEEGCGLNCAIHYHSTHHGTMGVAVTPVFAALLMEEEEMVRFLLERGARLDLSEGACCRWLQMAGTPEALELAARLPGIGYEKLSPEAKQMLEQTARARREETEEAP